MNLKKTALALALTAAIAAAGIFGIVAAERAYEKSASQTATQPAVTWRGDLFEDDFSSESQIYNLQEGNGTLSYAAAGIDGKSLAVSYPKSNSAPRIELAGLKIAPNMKYIVTFDLKPTSSSFPDRVKVFLRGAKTDISVWQNVADMPQTDDIYTFRFEVTGDEDDARVLCIGVREIGSYAVSYQLDNLRIRAIEAYKV